MSADVGVARLLGCECGCAGVGVDVGVEMVLGCECGCAGVGVDLSVGLKDCKIKYINEVANCALKQK